MSAVSPAPGSHGTAAASQAGERPFGIDFIDPLFAVAIHVGMVEGIMHETWFKEWRVPDRQELFYVATFLLGFSTLLLSWLGYHQSIKTKPLKGLARFVLDVVLVLAYAVMLVKFRNVGATLFLLAIAYFLFILWDLAKTREYADQMRWGRRELVTVGWCVVFWALWISYVTKLVPAGVCVFLAFVFTILYRVNKEKSLWGDLGKSIRRALIGN